MSYQVLALKYRPQTFSQVVGQEHVTQTLTNAISGNRVPHALLLAGPRGTGKTTIARIMAKAMACEKGPCPTPCDTCTICKDIINGHCADVFEIDGASNNSVEQIRELRDNVAYMPAAARYKVYIIDEVHMLSVAAFNALLKTLEEPPDHVLFIFATTEVHKIPATILSRCQRHDLSRIPLENISAHLEKLCGAEGYTVEKQGLDLIALEADGSIRDSLSLLDRILSAGPEKEISVGMVSQRLRVTDRAQLFAIARAVLDRDGATLIELVSQVNDSGMDLKKFYAGIISQFRNMSIISLCGTDTTVLNMTATDKQELSLLCKNCAPAYLGMLLDLLLKEENIIKFTSHTQTAVEMVLLKMIQVEHEIRLDDIITKVDLLARQMEDSPALPGSEPGGSPGPDMQDRPKSMSARSSAPEPKVNQTYAPANGKADQAPPSPMPPEPTPLPPEPITNPMPGPEAYTAPLPNDYSYQEVPEMNTAGVAEPAKPEIRPGARPEIETGPEPVAGPVDWNGFLQILQQKLPVIFGVLSKGQTDTTDPNQVTVTLSSSFCSDFQRHRLETKKKELNALCQTHLGKSININFIEIETPKVVDAAEKLKQERQQAEKSAQGHPMVQQAIRLFDADIL